MFRPKRDVNRTPPAVYKSGSSYRNFTGLHVDLREAPKQKVSRDAFIQSAGMVYTSDPDCDSNSTLGLIFKIHILWQKSILDVLGKNVKWLIMADTISW